MPSPRDPPQDRPRPEERQGAAPDGARRTFADQRGGSWTVREERIGVADWSSSDVESSESGYGVGWLVFERGDERRRLRLYPAVWHQASDHELRKLCARARRC